jgi:peroxiredoxin
MRPLTLPTRTFHNRRRVVVPMPMNSESLAALREAFLQCRDMDAALSERLEAYSGAVRKFIPDYADAVDRLVLRLSNSGAGSNAPQPGEPMPAFVLSNENGRLTGLESMLRNGPLAITFHRGHWCPWCRISGSALARRHRDINAVGGQVVAIVPEQQKFAAEFKASARYPFSVLTDLDNGYALSLNLAIWVGPDLERLLSSFGRFLPHYQGNDAWMLPIPATFVIGTDGRVAARFIDPDFRRRMSVEALIAALEAAH